MRDLGELAQDIADIFSDVVDDAKLRRAIAERLDFGALRVAPEGAFQDVADDVALEALERLAHDGGLRDLIRDAFLAAVLGRDAHL